MKLSDGLGSGGLGVITPHNRCLIMPEITLEQATGANLEVAKALHLECLTPPRFAPGISFRMSLMENARTSGKV